MKVPDISQYIEEKKKWEEDGGRLREPAKIKELFEICSNCEHYIKITKRMGQCGVCTCFLKEHGEKRNKLAWATTRCPLPEPRWIEEPAQEPVVEPVPIEEPEFVKPRYINRKKNGSSGGCGCS